MTTPADNLPARTADLSEIMLDGPLKDLAQAWAIAKMLSQSTMVPKALQGQPQNCLVTMMLGQELGLTWTQATRAIYVLPNGTPGLRGQFLLAQIRRAGHRYRFERAENYCKCIITRKDEDFKVEYDGEFSLDDAIAAQLVTKKDDGTLVARSYDGKPLPWEHYRREMLQWRSVARAAGVGAPEVVFGFDIAGIGEIDNPGSAPAGPQPPPQVVTAEVVDDGQQVRDKLAELDAQANVQSPAAEDDTTAGHGRAVADYDARPEGPGGSEAAAPGEGERKSTDPRADGATAPRSAQPSPPPDLNDVRQLLARCGYTTNSTQVDALGVLAHREVSSLSALTPGEILMAHDAITRAIAGAARKEQRHDELAKAIAAERDAMEDAEANPFDQDGE